MHRKRFRLPDFAFGPAAAAVRDGHRNRKTAKIAAISVR